MSAETQTKVVEKLLIEREVKNLKNNQAARIAWLGLFTDFLTMPLKRVATIQQTCHYGNAIEMHRLGIAPDSLQTTRQVFKHVWNT